MGRVIIIEPDITPEENKKNWERVEEIINSIADELESELLREKRKYA